MKGVSKNLFVLLLIFFTGAIVFYFCNIIYYKPAKRDTAEEESKALSSVKLFIDYIQKDKSITNEKAELFFYPMENRSLNKLLAPYFKDSQLRSDISLTFEFFRKNKSLFEKILGNETDLYVLRSVQKKGLLVSGVVAISTPLIMREYGGFEWSDKTQIVIFPLNPINLKIYPSVIILEGIPMTRIMAEKGISFSPINQHKSK